MSTVFKNKYMEGFLQLLKEQNKTIEASLRETLYCKSWIVYAKSPFGGPARVIEYLGRYTHKVAISNHRLVSINDDKVSFTYKDYADGSKQKIMTLDVNSGHVDPPFRDVDPPRLRGNNCKSFILVKNTKGY